MKSSLVVDTNIFTAYQRGEEWADELLSGVSNILVPTIVLGELYYGFFNGNIPQKNLAFLDEFMSSPRVSVLNITDATPRIFGEIAAELNKKGRPIQSDDIWIAALCKENNLPLATKDQGFQYILGLELIELS